MDYIKSSAACVIISLAAAAILKYLLPDGKAGKAADAVLSLMVIAALVSPFAEYSDISYENVGEFDFLEDITEADSLVVYREALEQSVKDALNENGIVCVSVEADMNIDGEGYININEIKIELYNTQDGEKAINAVTEKLGIDAETLSVR